MAAAGCHPGIMSTMRRIKAMPDGKRGFFLALLRRYVDVLEAELHDPAFVAEAAAPDEAPGLKPAEAGFITPFEHARGVAAA
jgi:hypothetical protein